VVEHLPPVQLSEQQSVLAEHALPAAAQVVSAATQPDFGSHTPEQQSPLAAQASPTAWQLLFAEPAFVLEPPVPTLPPPSGPVAALPAEPPVVELLPQPVQAAEAMMNVASRLRAIRILNSPYFFPELGGSGRCTSW
jgi:hypothetical protein